MELELKKVEVLKLQEGETIFEADVFNNAILLYAKKVTKIKLWFAKLNPEKNDSNNFPIFNEIKFSDNQFGLASPGANLNSEQSKIRFHFESPYIYEQIYDLDVENEKPLLLESSKLLGKPFKSHRYDISLVYAPGHDGVTIPITLLHRKGDLDSNDRPRFYGDEKKILLRTYGCYGMDSELQFNISDWSLLEREWIIAFAHIRGGGELGKKWHEGGLKDKKLNSVLDIVSCAQFLIAEGFTHPSILCASSNSAGAGLLASAVNIRPDLFKVYFYNKNLRQ